MTGRLFVIGFVLSHFTGFSQGAFQPGYIIKSNGDSIAGFVDISSNRPDRVCYFKAEKAGNKTRYNPSDLKAYGALKRFLYVSKNLPGQGDVFVEAIVKGSASLLKHKGNYFLEREGLYPLLKVGQGTQPGYVDVLNAQLADCDLKAYDTKYEEKEIAYLLQNYNRCKGAQGLMFNTGKKQATVHYSAFAGLDQSSMSISGYNTNAFNASTSATGGVGAELTLPNFQQKVGLSIEFWYGKRLYQGYSEAQTSSGITRTDILMNASLLRIPLGVRYSFLAEGRTPYIKAGFVKYALLNSSYQIRAETENNGVVTTADLSPKGEQKGPGGFWFSVGYSKWVRGGVKAFVEFRYESTSGSVTLDVQRTSNTTNAAFIIGIQY